MPRPGTLPEPCTARSWRRTPSPASCCRAHLTPPSRRWPSCSRSMSHGFRCAWGRSLKGGHTLIPHAAVNAAVIPGDSCCPSLAGTFGLSPVDRLCATNCPCSLQTSRQNLEPSGGLLPGLLRQLVGRRPASPDRPCCETGRVAFTSGWLPPLADGQPRGSKVPKAETGPTTA